MQQHPSIESGVQLFSRMKSERSHLLNGINPKLFPGGGPFGNDIIEVLFNEDTNYTDFFIDFIVRAVLPSTLSKEFKESQVILLHTDFQINLVKIIKFIEKKLDSCGMKIHEKKSVIEDALKKLIILNCYTIEQLEITFYNLERIIYNCHAPSVVILDNCLSQYWIKKFSNTMLSFDDHCMKIMEMLYQKIKDLNVVLIYGKPFTSDSVKKVPHLTYTIHIIKSKDGYIASVTNLEKNNCISAQFDINTCPEFI